jgi:hypothetical protein
VLVTGGLDFVMQPLARELGAEFYSPRLVEADGKFTGELTSCLQSEQILKPMVCSSCIVYSPSRHLVRDDLTRAQLVFW